MSTATLSLDALIELAQPDPRAIADGRRRMHDVFHHRPTDVLPILFAATAPEDIAWNADMRRHVDDPEQMLYDLVAGLVGWARAGSDAQLSIRVDTGTGTLASATGCQQLSSEYALPWTTHISRDAVEAFDPSAALASKGVLPRVRALYAEFRQRLPDYVGLYIADTQSPFDLAHLLYGDPLFYAMFDEPAFVHALLAKATTLYIEGSRLMKSWIDEAPDGGLHGTLAMTHGGVRACEDTATLLSPELIEEFVVPYRDQGLAPFGGGWVHYCGNNEHVYRSLLRSPWVRGINFGNPERHDFTRVLPELIAAGKFYYGAPPRGEEETLEAYFRRVISYTGGARVGLIFIPELRPDESVEPTRVLELWRGMQ